VSSKPTIPHDDEPSARLVADFVTREVPGVAPSDGGALVARLAQVRRVRRVQKWTLAATLLVGVVVAGVLHWRTPDARPLAPISYRVDQQAPPAGGYVVARDQAETVLEFSDGSSVRMAAHARGRVVELRSEGARFALEGGKLSATIRPRKNARWSFEAGPFLVRVHGTSFTLSWAPEEAVFVVRLLDGAVSITSPLSGSELELRAGQTLTVDLHEQSSSVKMTVDEREPPPKPPAAASAEPVASVPQPSASADLPLSTRWSNRGWSTRLAQGEAAAIIAEAERLGTLEVLQHADAEDLWAMANAARYAARYSLAEQALLAQRRRFPSTAHAHEAAFLLGRLHDGDAGKPEEALAWYARYLSETPRGPFASDALGRKMTLLERRGRRSEAVAVAEEYAQRFPAGTYAKAARVLIRAEAGAR
jgi:TolA-binding protein